MRKIMSLTALLLCLVLLTACGGGDVRTVARHIGTCERYSERQIADAMDEVEEFFKAEFDGCKLIRLSYDEEETLDRARGWSEQYDAEAIVLLSDFSVDSSGGDGSLNPNDTYRNWQWILTRTGTGGWELQTWGYG